MLWFGLRVRAVVMRAIFQDENILFLALFASDVDVVVFERLSYSFDYLVLGTISRMSRSVYEDDFMSSRS